MFSARDFAADSTPSPEWRKRYGSVQNVDKLIRWSLRNGPIPRATLVKAVTEQGFSPSLARQRLELFTRAGLIRHLMDDSATIMLELEPEVSGGEGE